MSKPNSPKSPKDGKGGEGGDESKVLDINELMMRLDEAVAKTIEDYSEIFITNVAEQRSVLEDSRDCIDKLGRENSHMLESFKRREREAFALQDVQTEEIVGQKAKIENLEAQLAHKNVEIEELHVHYKLELRKIIDAERLKRRQLQVKFGARVEELHNRLESVKTFIAQQDEVEERMEAAEKETKETRKHMADLAPGFQRKAIEQCLKYKEETDKKLAEFMKKVKEDIGIRINDRVKEVLAQNEILLAEIQMHASSTTGLQVETDRLKTENTTLRCEIELKHQAEELHVNRSRHQKHVIHHNNSKIQNLEKSLQQVIRQFSEERRILQEKHAYIVAEIRADNMKLKSIVLQKAQELKKFRHLAEIVIRQRGEVELFLLDSIQYVKNQIFLQKKIQSYQTLDANLSGNVSNNCASLDSGDRNTPGSTLPPINSHWHSSIKAPASWPGTGPWPRFKDPELHGHSHDHRQNIVEGRENSLVGHDLTEDQAEAQIHFLDASHDPYTIPVVLPMIDISELSWQDREKVLRYLFKKLNTARNLTIEGEHAKQTEAMQAMQAKEEKYQGYISEAGRTIV